VHVGCLFVHEHEEAIVLLFEITRVFVILSDRFSSRCYFDMFVCAFPQNKPTQVRVDPSVNSRFSPVDERLILVAKETVRKSMLSTSMASHSKCQVSIVLLSSSLCVFCVGLQSITCSELSDRK